MSINKIHEAHIYKTKKINNMFLRHFFLENDAEGQLFIFEFFKIKCYKNYVSE